MTFVSYAPNCEDVPLWRALGDVAVGRYVDWSSEPTHDASVTRAFYDRGWRGVSVRPHPDPALAAARPGDIVLTPSDPVPADTVHFLRIDADGQAAVLERVGFAAMAPWIVLIRAGDPDGDAMLEAAGYRFTLFDGLNRFYVASDQAARASRLAAPANVTDGFLRAADSAVAGRLAAAEAALQATEARLEGRAARLLDAVRATGQARSDVGVMHGESAWLRGLIDDARKVEDSLRVETVWLREQLATARDERAQQREGRAQQREDRAGQLLARVEEVAWLRGCLAECEARVLAERGAVEQLATRTAAAEAQAAALQRWADGMARSLSWKLTRPLRGVRRLFGGSW